MKRVLFIATLAGSLALASGQAFADGAKTYKAKCAGCHGNDGKGETPAGKKAGAKDFAAHKLEAGDIAKVVTDGKKKDDGKEGSPAFGKKLQPDEITAVADYVKATFMK